ncbi:FliM/FliN family flagellar motor switch protein [Palleronia abyssalis]|nr:FliM/FliN family flagellar motor C-terminal domain-containing protein [Palleronia abyssalis]
MSPLRRKIGAIRRDAPPPPSPERVWRRAVVHGLSRGAGLTVEVERPGRATILPEDAAPLMGEGMLTLLLDSAAGPGVLILEPGPMAALVEQQTLGRLGTRPPRKRTPTGTDAALVADAVDCILTTHEAMIDELQMAGAVTGFRYATPLSKPRDIMLGLRDTAHDHWKLPLKFPGNESREGTLHLVLPNEAAKTDDPADKSANWAEKMEARLMGSELQVTALLGEIETTVAAMRALRVGDRLTLPRESIGRVSIVGATGARIGEGRLGQSGGRKAVRLEQPGAAEFLSPEDDTMMLPDGMAAAWDSE